MPLQRACHDPGMRAILILLLISPLITIDLYAEDGSAQAHSTQPQTAPASPKSGWGEFTVVEERKVDPWWVQALLWVPNRLIDFVDIFRVDLGIGLSRGAIVRVSKYAQAGYRTMSPASVRVGAMGRRVPVMIERTNEIGLGPNFLPSKDREVCPGEVGFGADLFVAGAYGGICLDEAADFLAGLFFLDLKDDDLR